MNNGENMLLYHYANKQFSILKTREQQGIKPNSQSRKFAIEDYNKHISFFFEPIPLKLLSELFPKTHHTWFKGNTLIEHVIDTSILDKNIFFHVVETPLCIKLLEESGWFDENKVFTEEDTEAYFKNKFLLQKKNNEIGHSLSLLEKQIDKYKGQTEYYYKEASKKPYWEYINTKYAACVPHVMLYPKTGMIPVKEHHQCTVGFDKRILIIPDAPQITKW